MRERSLFLILALCAAGCSPHDPPTLTPTFHVGTPTNRSSVNSWEINTLGQRVPAKSDPKAVLKPIASQQGFEPSDPLAEAVYHALTDDGSINGKYLSPRAKNGVVILVGTVDDAGQKAKAEQIARAVPGVKQVINQLTVAHP